MGIMKSKCPSLTVDDAGTVLVTWLRFGQVIRYCSCIIQGSGINNDTLCITKISVAVALYHALEKHGLRRIYFLLLANMIDEGGIVSSLQFNTSAEKEKKRLSSVPPGIMEGLLFQLSWLWCAVPLVLAKINIATQRKPLKTFASKRPKQKNEMGIRGRLANIQP